MPVTTYTLSGDFNALVGDVKNLSATIHLNTEDGSWVNEADDLVILGGAQIVASRSSAATSGSFTIALPTSNGTGLQYEVRATYIDPSDQSRKSWRSGWFALTANANLADKANDSSLRVNPSLGAQLAARIDGYVDHGNVSGAQTFSGPTGSHWFNATAATTITLASYAEGQVITLICFTGAENVTIAGLPDAELTDGTAWSAQLVRGVWVTGGGGGGTPAVPDTTPPTAISGLTATGGSGQVSGSWTASTDAESTVSYRWRVWLTSGGATGTWTTTTSTSMLKTGLTGGNYTLEVYAYSNGGSTTTATATATVTTPVTYDIGDDFNSANTGSINGRTTSVGAKTWTTPWTTGLGSNPLGITSNKLSDASGNGSARVLPAATNYTVTCTYDVSVGSSQVRLYARADGTNAEADNTASVAAVMRNSGEVSVERGNDYSLGTLGTGNPTTGTLTLEVSGTTGRVLVNGTQVGASFSISSVVGTYAGIGIYAGGRADNFEIDYL